MFKNKKETYSKHNKDNENYYLIYTTYATKLKKQYPKTKMYSQ